MSKETMPRIATFDSQTADGQTVTIAYDLDNAEAWIGVPSDQLIDLADMQ